MRPTQTCRPLPAEPLETGSRRLNRTTPARLRAANHAIFSQRYAWNLRQVLRARNLRGIKPKHFCRLEGTWPSQRSQGRDVADDAPALGYLRWYAPSLIYPLRLIQSVWQGGGSHLTRPCQLPWWLAGACQYSETSSKMSSQQTKTPQHRALAQDRAVLPLPWLLPGGCIGAFSIA
jgi:hypothetical protein